MEHKQHADAAEQRCVLVADTPIAEIRAHVSRCPHLEHLELAGCVHVDDALVAFLLRLLTRLTTLDVSGCPQITPLSLQALRSWADGAVGLEHAGKQHGLISDRMADALERLRQPLKSQVGIGRDEVEVERQALE